MEFWWRIGWLPAVSAPLTWYATVIRYAGLAQARQRLHRRILLAFAALGLAIVVLLVTDNPFATYRSLLVEPTPASEGASQILVWLYLGLNVAGFALPVVALAGGRREQVAWAHNQARPWLIGTGVFLLAASGIVAVTAVWAMKNAIPLLEQEAETVSLLLAADLAAESLVALATISLGRAVVAYEVFTERPLPRQGFFRRWRSVVLAAAGAAATVTILIALEARPLYSLTLLSLLGMSAYALFTWQSYRAHERFISRLLPFVRSLGLADRLLSLDSAGDFSAQAADLLRALCEEALGAPGADLILEGETPRRISYRRPGSESVPLERVELRIAIPGGPGTSGALLLPPKRDGRAYSAEEIELAHACGERLLDTLAGERVAHTLMDLLRRRLGELQVVSSLHKRVLHDEVLPEIHLALLQLQGRPSAVEPLTRAHQTISEMLHAGPRSAVDQIAALGLLDALREVIGRDFGSSFRSINWVIDDFAAQEMQDRSAGVGAEVMYYAALEAIRNAARHAPGPDPGRPVSIRIRARWTDGLELTIEDDGVGLNAPPAHPGGREGLLIHSTMMAVAGGSLTTNPGPEGAGTMIRLWLPAVSLPRPSPSSR
jgi:two-component sensor histidine kinase